MKESIGFKLYKHFFTILFVVATLAPFAFLTLTSLRTMEDITKNGPLALPSEWVLSNYPRAWELGNFRVYYTNSIKIAIITVAAVLVISLLGAYVFSFLKFPCKSLLFSLILLGLMIPFQQIMIPLFHTLRDVHLLNTHWAVILPQIAMELAFGIFLLRGFMRDLPISLIESARLDGAGEARILWSIVTPLVRPALVSLLIFVAMSSWNNFMLPTIMLQKDALRTVPVGINYFKDQHFTDFPMLCAAANIIIIPIVIIYLIFQKRMIQGMMVGSVKE